VARLLGGGGGGAFNLGTGCGHSVKEVLDAIATETGETLSVSQASRREGDPPVLVADASLSRAELGFTPRLSDLKTIIATAFAWHRRAHPKIDKPSSVRSVQGSGLTTSS
jgi:UDP-arabinose 4-epimerase